MIRIPKVLIVDDSTVLRDMLTAVLNPHCGEIISAHDCAGAREQIREHRDLSLVLCDVILPDGNGLDLLEEIVADADAPDVLMMTGRPDEADARRAATAGAIGYLAKPITFRDIAEAARQAEGKRSAAPRVRCRPVGRAYMVGRVAGRVATVTRDGKNVWTIRDMSMSGAFLETTGPVAVGTLLDLCLDFGTAQARVRARAVRLQEPDWGLAGGVGIAFRDFDPGSRELLAKRLTEFAASGA